MRKSTLLYTGSLLVAGLLFAQSCQKDNQISQLNTKATAAVVSASDKYSIMTNAEDPLLMSIVAGPADTIFLYGTRDKSGLPCTLEAIFQIRNNTATRLYLDDKGRPLIFVAENGVKLKYDWLTSDYARVTAFTEESGNLTDFIASINFSNSPIVNSTMDNINGASKKSIPSYNGLLKLSLCGKPLASDDIFISVSGDGTAGLKIANIVPFTALSTGQYIFKIPGLADHVVNPCDASAKINKLLSAVCIGQKVISQSNLVFNALIISKKIQFVSAAAFTAASAGADQLFSHLCLIPSATDLPCENIGVNRTFSNVRLAVFAVRGRIIQVAPGATFTTLNIDIPSGGSEIRSLVLNPPSPSPLERYTAMADIFCIPKGSTVFFTAEGSDGITTSKTFTVDTENFNGTYLFDVAGSDAGTLERVAVTVSSPDGRSYSRVIYHLAGG